MSLSIFLIHKAHLNILQGGNFALGFEHQVWKRERKKKDRVSGKKYFDMERMYTVSFIIPSGEGCYLDISSLGRLPVVF